MTEHSGQQSNPTDALRRTMAEQHSLIQTHIALHDLGACQAETNCPLKELSKFLQNSLQQTSAPASIPRSVSPVYSTFSEIHPPTLEKFSGDINRCKGFLLQWSLVFNHSPRYFPRNGAKIAFIISLLTGQALDWAEARFPMLADFGCMLDEFLREFKQVFSQDSDKTSNSRELWRVK